MGVAGEFMCACGSDHLRDVGIDMQTFELVAMIGERIEERLLVKTSGRPEILPIPSYSVEIAQYLTHSTVLRAQHTLHVLIAERA
jgi:hypothetical protein